MRKKLNWSIYSNSDRNKVIESIKNAISKSDGCILNFNLFSDLAMGLSVEIEENKIQTLHRELSSMVELSEIGPDLFDLKSKKEWLIFINASFGKGLGNLKNEIPNVPG